MNRPTPSPFAGDAAYDPAALHPRLAALRRAGPPGPDALEAFAAATQSPLVEPGAVTFVFVGEAERVELLRWIHGGVDRAPFTRWADAPLWTLRAPVEDGGRFEYKLNVVREGREQWVLDPMNPARAADPYGENSVCRTWGYRRPDWSLPQGAPEGAIETVEIASQVFGETRREKIYLPAGYDAAAPHPLIVIHDGQDYMAFADLRASLDNLIAAGDIPPVIAALIQTGDRMGEYPRGRRHARFLVEELLATLRARHPISEDPRQRVLLGASLGAVASLSAAFRYPGVFGGLVLKSGSFILDPAKLAERPHPVFQRVARLVEALQRAPGLPGTRAFISTGELEGLADENRALAEFLRARGVDVRFQSSWDGHHWHNWRDQLRDGLMWVFGRDAG